MHQKVIGFELPTTQICNQLSILKYNIYFSNRANSNWTIAHEKSFCPLAGTSFLVLVISLSKSDLLSHRNVDELCTTFGNLNEDKWGLEVGECVSVICLKGEMA